MHILKSVALILTLFLSLVAHGNECFTLISKVFKETSLYKEVLTFKPGQSLGMEFEGTISEGLSNYDIALIISDLYKDSGLKAHVVKDNSDESAYQVVFYHGNIEKKLTVLDDTSLNNSKIGKGIEITSPVMTSDKDVKLFTSTLQQLKNAKILNTEDDLGGIHIHYGVPNLTIGQLKTVMKFFYLNSQTVKSAFKMRETRMQINSMSMVAAIDNLEKYPSNALVKDTDLKVFFPKSIIRYKEEIETLELRVFNSSLDTNEQLKDINFTLRVFETLLEVSEEFSEKVMQVYTYARLRMDPEEVRFYSGLHDNEIDSDGDPYLQSLFALISGQ